MIIPLFPEIVMWIKVLNEIQRWRDYINHNQCKFLCIMVYWHIIVCMNCKLTLMSFLNIFLKSSFIKRDSYSHHCVLVSKFKLLWFVSVSIELNTLIIIGCWSDMLSSRCSFLDCFLFFSSYKSIYSLCKNRWLEIIIQIIPRTNT